MIKTSAVAMPNPTFSAFNLLFSALPRETRQKFKDLNFIGDFEKMLDNVMNFIALISVPLIRDKIQEKGLVKTGAMNAGIFAEKKEYNIVFYSRQIYTKYLDRGVRPHPMTYLKGKTIPFIVKGGKFMFAGRGSGVPKKDIIFRKVTSKSLSEGSWFHPGIKPQEFFMEALEEVVKKVSEKYPFIKLNIEMY